jgi:predicted secreted protein
MVALRHRLRRIPAVAAVLMTVGCLGQDYRDVDLALSDWDHAWLAVLEPEEPFTVGLPEHPQHGGEPWSIVADGSPVLEVTSAAVDQPAPEEDPAPAFWIYDVVARDLGEARLAFHLDIDGKTVDRAEFQVAVVEDACASDQGLAAPRCGGPQQVTAPQGVSEREHGSTVMLTEGDDAAVVLTGNATRSDAVWQIAASDPAAVDVSEPRDVGSRSPGNWSRDDASEPGTFLPRSEFPVTGIAPSRSTVRFELIDAAGVVESAVFTFQIDSR